MQIKPEDVINLNEMHALPKKREPAIDRRVSNIVGKEIRITDPRLIKLVTKWKQAENKGDESTVTSNYLEDEEKIEELKKVFNN